MSPALSYNKKILQARRHFRIRYQFLKIVDGMSSSLHLSYFWCDSLPLSGTYSQIYSFHTGREKYGKIQHQTEKYSCSHKFVFFL